MISNISHLLGFTTSRAKLVVWEGIDHHWSKQILSVCLDAIRKELLMSFARKCKTRKYQPFNYYINSGWKLSITKLNYFMTALCFHISYCSTCSWKQQGKTTLDYIMAACVQFGPIFYSFDHPKYQQLLLIVIWMRVQTPETLRQYLQKRKFEHIRKTKHWG